ncbi:hypothetical protein BJ875DRAFT_446151 [Amylocarpus encephaloides]|uniref:Uncharacterized protein n=1 Tax=Amylocarpus encephaloides TaxID=45428 RepID=A0A9P7Y8Q6_9HELO|nr:hypothetical protein BJ875DRAFT_446151 [Amylocarpus encephaloides]
MTVGQEPRNSFFWDYPSAGHSTIAHIGRDPLNSQVASCNIFIPPIVHGQPHVTRDTPFIAMPAITMPAISLPPRAPLEGGPYYITLTIAHESTTECTTVLLGAKTSDPPRSSTAPEGQSSSSPMLTSISTPGAIFVGDGGGDSGSGSYDSAPTALIVEHVGGRDMLSIVETVEMVEMVEMVATEVMGVMGEMVATEVMGEMVTTEMMGEMVEMVEMEYQVLEDRVALVGNIGEATRCQIPPRVPTCFSDNRGL